jgi:hypothetical protein
MWQMKCASAIAAPNSVMIRDRGDCDVDWPRGRGGVARNVVGSGGGWLEIEIDFRN